MREARSTFVVTLEEDVAEFLDIKHKSASELNAYINEILQQEKNRQQKSPQREAADSGWVI